MKVKINNKVNIIYSQSSLFIFIMNYFNIILPDNVDPFFNMYLL